MFSVYSLEQYNDDHTEGISILSDYPLQDLKTNELSHTEVRRIYMKVFIEELGVYVTNTHLSFTETDESHKQLIQVLRSPDSGRQEFLTGDFNQMPDITTPVFKKFPRWRCDVESNTWPADAEQFKAAREKASGKPVDFDITPRQIDYISSSGEPKLLSSIKHDLYGSDRICASDHALVLNKYAL